MYQLSCARLEGWIPRLPPGARIFYCQSVINFGIHSVIPARDVKGIRRCSATIITFQSQSIAFFLTEEQPIVITYFYQQCVKTLKVG
jgi:hypothetical protein